MNETPKVFISYSWSTPDHEDWVINLAERLVSDGVDVIFDKWDLKEGQDKYSFMEGMVQSSDIDRVLIILDKKYSEKANSRSGGVGTEAQIISPKIYANVSQEKFIPIVTERDMDGNEYVPNYLVGRIYIDLSSHEKFEENYESVLRNIFKRPAFSKPQLGKAPSYLFEETPLSYRTSSIIRSLDNQIDKFPKRINSILRDFLDEFYRNIQEYTIVFSSKDQITIGKEICDSINLYTPLRNDLIYFFNRITKGELEFDIEVLIRFLEKLPLLKYPQNSTSSWSSYEFDNFKFYIHELFLYLITIGIKNENYHFVEELLYSSYFFHVKYDYKNDPKTYGELYSYIESVTPYYNKTFSKNYTSPMAELLINRIPENFTIDILIEADLLCHYVGVLNDIRWFPITYIYKTRGKFELFDRLVSLRHFEKVKCLFNIATAQELKDKLTIIKQNDNDPRGLRFSGAFDSVIPIYRMIDIDKIALTR